MLQDPQFSTFFCTSCTPINRKVILPSHRNGQVAEGKVQNVSKLSKKKIKSLRTNTTWYSFKNVQNACQKYVKKLKNCKSWFKQVLSMPVDKKKHVWYITTRGRRSCRKGLKKRSWWKNSPAWGKQPSTEANINLSHFAIFVAFSRVRNSFLYYGLWCITSVSFCNEILLDSNFFLSKFHVLQPGELDRAQLLNANLSELCRAST